MKKCVAWLLASLAGPALAQQPFFFPPVGYMSANGPPCTSTTWNPSDKDAAISLSNGNLTATQGGASSSWKSVRATTSHMTGKYYFELGMDSIDGAHGWMGGVADATMALSNYMGVSTDGIGCQPLVGFASYWYNAGQPGDCSATGASPGIALEIAVDLDNNLIWERQSNEPGGLWNNDASADPATGVNGHALHIAGGSVAVFPAWSGFNNGTGSDISTINTVGSGGCPFLGSVPSGFVIWQ